MISKVSENLTIVIVTLGRHSFGSDLNICPAPFLFPCSTYITLFFSHLVPGAWHAACPLSNRYSSFILQVSSQTRWSWQRDLLPDSAQDVTPAPSSWEENFHLFTSPVIGIYFLFLSIFQLRESTLYLAVTMQFLSLQNIDRSSYCCIHGTGIGALYMLSAGMSQCKY